MRPVVVSQTGTGSTTPIVMDINKMVFSVGIGCVINGTVNYTVEHSFDDPFTAGYTPAGATWFPHTSLAAKTANADGNYAYPCRAVRLTVNSGSGTVTMTVIQGG